MFRFVAVLAGLVLIILAFGARAADQAAADPIRTARLTAEARAQADAAASSLAAVDGMMRSAIDHARHGQADILSGADDPSVAMTAAANDLEATADALDGARADLDRLAWTLRAVDQDVHPPSLDLTAEQLRSLSAQWRAAALPSSSLADLRRHSDETLAELDDALAALDADDPDAAVAALDRADAALDAIRPSADDMPTLPVWIDTVDQLIRATRAIAAAAAARDPEALARAQAVYEAVATNAHRADQALTIALGEAASQATGPATAASAEALRAVAAARDEVAALSILR